MERIRKVLLWFRQSEERWKEVGHKRPAERRATARSRPPEVIMSQVEQTTRDRSAMAVAYQKPEFWAKGFGKLIFSNLLVLVMCVIPLELYFGSWVRPKPWGLLCDVHFTLSWKSMNGVEKTIDYVRDSQCLRGSYNASSIDVITVGGSTTDQRYITEGETWQDSIERYFHKNRRQLSIANAGVDGQSTIGHLWDFEYWFPKLSSQRKVYSFTLGPTIFTERARPVLSTMQSVVWEDSGT